MKILVISPYPPSIDSTGHLASNISEGITSARNDVQILVLADGIDERESPTDYITVVRCWNKSQGSRQIRSQLEAMINSYNPDIVHLHYNYLTFGSVIKSHGILKFVVSTCKAKKKQIVVTLHSVISSPLKRMRAEMYLLRFPTPGSIDRLCARVFDRDLDLVLENCDLLVLPSCAAFEFARKRMEEMASRCKVSYIPLGYSVLDEPSPQNQSSAKSQKGLHILFYGAITPYKGLHILLQSVRQLMLEGFDISLDVVGEFVTHGRSDPRYYHRIMTSVRKLGLQAICKFQVSHYAETELLQRLAKADVAVFPTLFDGTLSSSASPYPALFSGTKVVITDSPRLIDFSEVPGVFMAKVGDSTDLAKAIARAAGEDARLYDRHLFELIHDRATVCKLYFEAFAGLLNPDKVGCHPRG